jgi:hypothetical protein
MKIIEVEEEPLETSWLWLKKEKRGSVEEMTVDSSGNVAVDVDASSIVSDAILIF